MTIQELKEYIYSNGKIKYILEEIGCHHIKYHQNKEYFTCANTPSQDGDGNNKTAITLYNNENLGCINYTRNIGKPADLITLVGYNKNLSFVESIKYLHKLLGLNYKNNYKNNNDKEDKIDPLEVFKKIKRKRNNVNVNDIEIYDSTIIEEYIPLPHINWIREGILPFTCEVFGIGYSIKKNRIVIPWHYWAGAENDIVGVMGRSTLSSEQCDMLDIPKYLPLKAFPKSLHIYGLQQNYKNIINSNLVYVFESEKSVLKLHSRGIKNAVAIGSHCLSNEQIKILIGLNVEIVICYDKDIKLDYVLNECKKFKHIRKCSYIFDEWDLLEEKESPADKHWKIFKFMSKYRKLYK